MRNNRRGDRGAGPSTIEIELSAERFEAVLASISDGVFTVDPHFRITCFNRAAEEITGFTREEALGRPCREIFRASICGDACPLRSTMQSGKAATNISARITSRAGEEIPISISTSLFRDKRGNVIGGVETFRDLRHVEELRRELEGNYSFENILSKSTVMKNVLRFLPTIAATESTVLVTGESGTGKELVARAIHNLSMRKNGPFVAVNTAGFPDTLIEAELFGYEAGAFTGARKAKPGRFALADGGTLFLDEIGDISIPIQAKLLRVLQERVYEPLGATAPVKADVRIVTATHRDLKAMVEEGSFRKDLFYRINVIEVHIPPLRDRMEDVPLLVHHFLRRFAALHARNIEGISTEALKVLLNYDYPGNVRELQNIVEHAVVLCTGSVVLIDHLPEHLRGARSSVPVESDLEEFERQRILKALESHGWNRNAAARALGIHRTTLFRKIRRLGIQLPLRSHRNTPEK